MAQTNGILGQSVPAANTATTLYTVAAITQANGSLFVCNQGDKSAKIYVAVTKSGNTLAAKDYIVSEKMLATKDTLKIEGFALNDGDFVTIKSSKANVSFNLIGYETA